MRIIFLGLAVILCAGCSRSEPMFKPTGAPIIKLAMKLAKTQAFDGAEELALPDEGNAPKKVFVAKETVVTNDDVAGTSVSKTKHDPNQWQIEVALKPAAKDKFAQLTKDNIDHHLAIYSDDKLIAAPVIRSEIRDGLAVISGKYSEAEATRLAKGIVGQ